MRRFFIDPNAVQGGVVTLSREESHHAVSVLRLKRNDALELFDGGGNRFGGRVVDIKEGRVSVRLDAGSVRTENKAAPAEVTLAVSVIRPERMDILVQKAAELGAHAILPVLSDRSIVKLSPERWGAKVERWRKIARESCKQCGQPNVPEVGVPRTLKEILEAAAHYDKILIPTLEVPGAALRDALGSSEDDRRILALVGPEGDFTVKEVEAAASRGAVPVSLGPLVLRSETAALYLLSVLNFYYREVAPRQDARRGL